MNNYSLFSSMGKKWISVLTVPLQCSKIGYVSIAKKYFWNPTLGKGTPIGWVVITRVALDGPILNVKHKRVIPTLKIESRICHTSISAFNVETKTAKQYPRKL